MNLEDFINNYDSVGIVRIYEKPWRKISVSGRWSGATAGGCSNNDTFKNNPQFKLTVPRNTPAVFNLQQKDKRGMGKDKKFCIGWSALQLNGFKLVEERAPPPVYKSGTFTNSRDKFTELNLKASKDPYTIVCSTFEPGNETDFTLTIITKEEVFVESF